MPQASQTRTIKSALSDVEHFHDSSFHRTDVMHAPARRATNRAGDLLATLFLPRHVSDRRDTAQVTSRHRRVDHAFAAVRMTSITNLGWESIGTWLLSTS